jgi:hypothetical protein
VEQAGCYSQIGKKVERLRVGARPFLFWGDNMGRTTTTKAGGSNRPATEVSDPISACRKCKRWVEMKQRMRVAKFIERTVAKVESRLDKGEISPTVAEYLKLLQLEQEWEQQESGADGPKEIKVTWVGPVATSNSER